MTWIKQKPYFTGEPKKKVQNSRSKQRLTQKRRQKTGCRLWSSEGGRVCVQTSGIHICKGAEGGANSASTGRGDGQQRKNMRWREQRQWLIHERSHVLNFLRSSEEWVSYSPPQSPQAKKGFALCQQWLITAQPPPFSVRDKWGTAVSQPRVLKKVEFPGWRGL